MEWVEGKWGRLSRRCRCRCCTYRLGRQYCGLYTGWSRGGQKGKIGQWIVTEVGDAGFPEAAVAGHNLRGAHRSL